MVPRDICTAPSQLNGTYEWFMSHACISHERCFHIKFIPDWDRTAPSQLNGTYKWSMSHAYMSHVTRIRTYERVRLHIRTSQSTHMRESHLQCTMAPSLHFHITLHVGVCVFMCVCEYVYVCSFFSFVLCRHMTLRQCVWVLRPCVWALHQWV